MIRTVFGRRGSGKTTLIKNRIRESPRVAAFDITGEYCEIGEVANTAMMFVEALEQRAEKPFRVVFYPDGEPDWNLAFDYFLRACWAARNLLIVADEIDQLASPTQVPPTLYRNLNMGRHRGLDLIAASRRPANVPRLLTSQSDEIIIFNCSEPNDVKYIQDFAGKQFALACQSLPIHHYLLWDCYGAGGEQDLAPRIEPYR